MVSSQVVSSLSCGQACVDFKDFTFELGTLIEEETIRTLDNVKAIIERAGATMDDGQVYSA